MLDTWAPDQDESERGVTCSVRSAACPGPSVVRWNWTSLRTACWMFAGRLGPGPMYTWECPIPCSCRRSLDSQHAHWLATATDPAAHLSRRRRIMAVPGHRPSAFQAWHIPSRGEMCERPALLLIADGSRRLPPLLSAVRAWPARPADQIPAAWHAGRSWLGRERLPAAPRAVGGKPESAAVPGAGQPRKLGQIGIVRNSPART